MSTNNSREVLARLEEIRTLSLNQAAYLRSFKDPSETAKVSAALRQLDCAHEELRVVREELQRQATSLNPNHEKDLELQRYSELFEIAPIPYLITDPQAVIREANLQACELLGIASQYLIGKPLTVFIRADDLAWRKALKQVHKEEVVSFDLHLQPRNSKPLVVRAKVQCSQWEEDTKPPTLQWVLHETREQFLEHELQVERRARQEAEQAVQRSNRVLAFVAHELRNPLNIAAGWLELLRREDIVSFPDPGHIVEVLTRNVQTVSRLVDELVDQTRIAQDHLELKRQKTDVRALLERICEDARGVAAIKRQRLECELQGHLGTIACDPFRLQQALNNILSNALKFTPPQEIIWFQAWVKGERLLCRIRDSGPGIAPQYLKTIFEPYVRVKSPDAAAARSGLGLGLHIARQIIELHGGSIHAESDGPGTGAVFHVALPLNGLPAA